MTHEIEQIQNVDLGRVDNLAVDPRHEVEAERAVSPVDVGRDAHLEVVDLLLSQSTGQELSPQRKQLVHQLPERLELFSVAALETSREGKNG